MEEFDETEVIRSSEFQENPDRATLKFLRRDYDRLVETTEEQSEKCDSMEAMLVEMTNTLLQLCNQLGIHPIEAESSNQTPPVTFSDSYVRDDQNRLPMDNRKNLLRKIEMPKFDGYNAYDWLSKVERFFSVRRYSDLDKLDLVALSLEGDVLIWFDREMTRCEFHSWEEFRRRLFLRFGAAPEEAPGNRLFDIKQTECECETNAELSVQVIEQQTVYKEASITQLQVPVSKLEHSLQIHNESPNVCENYQDVVGCAELGTEANMFSGLSQTSQVWEPGGVLASHVLVDWLMDFNGYDGIVDGIRCLEIGVCSGIKQPIDSRRASRLWERGGLDISPELTDWLMKCYKGFAFSRLMRKLHQIDLLWVMRKDLDELCVGQEKGIMRLKGASNGWCGWMVFDRGKNKIISGDFITLVFLDLKKCFFKGAEKRNVQRMLLVKAQDAHVDSLIVRIKELWIANMVEINTGVSGAELKWIIWSVSSNIVEATKVNVNSETRHGVGIILILKRGPKLEGNCEMRGLLGIPMSCFGDNGSVLVMVLYFNLDGKKWYTKRELTTRDLKNCTLPFKFVGDTSLHAPPTGQPPMREKLEAHIAENSQVEMLASIDTNKGYRSTPVAISATSRPGSTIHDVFLVSQLKDVIGDHQQVHSTDPPELLALALWIPEAILEERFDEVGRHEFLIKWQNHDASENSWMFSKDFVQLYPSFKLEDKLIFQGGSIDMNHQACHRKNKKKMAVEVDVVARLWDLKEALG